ncbi:hypothetical protein GCM10009539_72310 [Cryptosporangium japonicum]|uniref:Uncharacterized protein n=1 Tax=Cryptosporangium japonicum TaxID=80872 RepID=A0ABN0V406_9ACTN
MFVVSGSPAQLSSPSFVYDLTFFTGSKATAFAVNSWRQYAVTSSSAWLNSVSNSVDGLAAAETDVAGFAPAGAGPPEPAGDADEAGAQAAVTSTAAAPIDAASRRAQDCVTRIVGSPVSTVVTPH